jgi:hypothetical protein
MYLPQGIKQSSDAEPHPKQTTKRGSRKKMANRRICGLPESCRLSGLMMFNFAPLQIHASNRASKTAT